MATLNGTIQLTRRLRDHVVWDQDPACYGKAWVDLLLLANDAPRQVTIHGEVIPLKRGQLAWSQRRLEEQWKRTDFWVRRFLKFCEEQTMITLDVTRRRTIITIINFDAYNLPKNCANLETESGTDLETESGTDLEQKGETGRGIGNGERPPAKNDFVEVPDEAEVLAYGRSYAGDLARGIPAGMPVTWVSDWLRYKVGTGTLPKKWREKMALDFARDYTARHPKALGGPVVGKGSNGRTPAQQRFELSRELEELQVRLDAAYENSIEPSVKDRAREKELKALIKALPE